MITTIRVLKRKDGASLVAGIALGIITSQFLAQIVMQLTTKIANLGSNTTLGVQSWRAAYLIPIVSFILELIALEIVIWLYILLHDSVGGK